MKNILTRLSLVIITFFGLKTYGQKSNFVSAVDQDLSIKTVAVLPMVDNLSGIYATPLSTQLHSLVSSDKQWSLTSFSKSKFPKPEELEENPELVKSLLKEAKVDGIISSRITKGPQGITLRIKLFSGREGFLLAESTLQNYQGFEISDLRTQVASLYEELKRKIPYDGVLLSRKGTLVTLNLGSQQGALENQEVNVIQIIKVQRHPKFHFLISSEQEILGQIKIKKVDENLSFGTIVSERGEGSLQAGQKFLIKKFVRYPETPITADQKLATDLTQRDDTPVAFGDHAGEWVPDRAPSFGKIEVLLGLSQYTLSNNLTTSGGLSATNSFSPTIQVGGELWINPEWFGTVSLRQYVFSVSNPGGGSPSKLSVATSQYSLSGGYNFLVAEKFFGPKIQLTAGYSKFSSTVDQSSPMTAFTSQSYSGLMIGVGGSFPLELESKDPISLGASLNLFLTPTLDETPVDSGNSKSNITSFSAFLIYKYSNRLNLKGLINYDLLSSTFTGVGSRGEAASSSSQTITTLAGGIEYQF
jgi:hypothetical protein